MSGWESDIDTLVLDAEAGDRVVFEYDGARGRKTGTVEMVNRGYHAKIRVDVDGAENPWTIANFVSTSYEDKNRGAQTRHLGNLERIRVIG